MFGRGSDTDRRPDEGLPSDGPAFRTAGRAAPQRRRSFGTVTGARLGQPVGGALGGRRPDSGSDIGFPGTPYRPSATPRRRDGPVKGSTVLSVGVSSETRIGWGAKRSPPRVSKEPPPGGSGEPAARRSEASRFGGASPRRGPSPRVLSAQGTLKEEGVRIASKRIGAWPAPKRCQERLLRKMRDTEEIGRAHV